MKMAEAQAIIDSRPNEGYMVDFEHVEGKILRSDHFPDKHAGEKLIPTKQEAWILARQFADKTWDKCVNIYVTDETFSPVRDYKSREIKNRL